MGPSMHVRQLIVLLLACLGGAALSAQSTKERAQPPAADDVALQALDYPRLSAPSRSQGQALDLPR